MSGERDGATVLAVDDLRDYLDVYEHRLGDRYDVRTASSGERALEVVSTEVDVVLLDRDMPDVPGDEVLERVRAAGYDCRVAMVTANEPDEDVIGLGYDAYVQKPVSGEELTDAVERLLSLSAYADAVAAFHDACERRARSEGGAETAERVRRLRERADDIADGFDERDYRVVFRELR